MAPRGGKSAATGTYGDGDANPEAKADLELRQRLDARMVSLETWRYSWWVHWAELARYILPRRYRWLTTPNQWQKGTPINQNIIDNTGTIAADRLASGMMAGITSPSKPWFRLAPSDMALIHDTDVKTWVSEVQKRMLRVMASSNYYLAKHVQYEDLAVFGTAPMIIYEDRENIIRCYNPCAGEYYAAVGASNAVDTLYRKIAMTVTQIVDEFGLEACSPDVQSAWKTGGGSRDQEKMVCHAIEPDPEYVAAVGRVGSNNNVGNGRFREFYWEYGQQTGKFLRREIFFEQPFSCPRWHVTGNDAYGRSPGMTALGDIKQLQLQQKRKAQAIDKIVNPPMVADPAMKNEPASLLPGAVNYVPTLTTGKSGFSPAYQVNPYLGDLTKDMMEVQTRIREAFYNDIFLMITQLDTVRTATEIDARREEKLIQLGPVLERNENEALSPDINRIFRIMMRFGLIPKPPDVILRAGNLRVEYVSMLAEAQRATEASSIERWWQFGGGIAAAKPGALDLYNEDASVQAYADILRVDPTLVNSPRQVAAMRAQRAEAEAKAEAMQQASAGVEGAKVLSETEVGGGQNALQLMLNGAPSGAV